MRWRGSPAPKPHSGALTRCWNAQSNRDQGLLIRWETRQTVWQFCTLVSSVLNCRGCATHPVEKLHSSVCGVAQRASRENHKGLVSLVVAHKNCTGIQVGGPTTQNIFNQEIEFVGGQVKEFSAHSYGNLGVEEAKLGIDLSEKSCPCQMLSRTTRFEVKGRLPNFLSQWPWRLSRRVPRTM
jgi:hypothetical protein